MLIDSLLLCHSDIQSNLTSNIRPSTQAYSEQEDDGYLSICHQIASFNVASWSAEDMIVC